MKIIFNLLLIIFFSYSLNAQKQSELITNNFEFDSILIKFSSPKEWKFKKNKKGFFFYDNDDEKTRIYVGCLYNRLKRTNEQIKESVEDSFSNYNIDYYFEIDGQPVVKTVNTIHKKINKKRVHSISHLEKNLIFLESTHIIVGFTISNELSLKKIKSIQEKISTMLEDFVKSFEITKLD